MHRLLGLAVVCLAAACSGGSGSPAPVDVPFQVSQVLPAPASEDVPLTAEINVVFTKRVDPVTLHQQSFDVIAESGDRILGIRRVPPFNQNLVRFLPDQGYLPFAVHRIVLNPQIRDQDGNALDQSYEFEFQTQEAGPVLPGPDQVRDLGPLLRVGRFFHRMTALPSNRFLVTGGYPADGQAALSSAENLIPELEQSSLVPGGMKGARAGHVQVPLADGRILLAGGEVSSSPFIPLATCEVFDPAPGAFTFELAASMHEARSFAHAARLPDGRVLVTGGMGRDASGAFVFRNDAEIYDPASDSWELLGPRMLSGRATHLSARTQGSDVVIIGGTGTDLPSATLFRSATGSFSAQLGTPFFEHTFGAGTVLPDGRPFLAGGSGTRGVTLHDPQFGFLGGIGTMQDERVFATATAFADGRVLIVGGIDLQSAPPLVHATMDVFFPVGHSGKVLRATGVTLPRPTSHHAAARGPEGAIWITGGIAADGVSPAHRQVTVVLPE